MVTRDPTTARAAVIAKVQKLLALGASPNEAEAQSAIAKAQAIMAEWALTLQDLAPVPAQAVVIQLVTNADHRHINGWRHQLATALQHAFPITVYRGYHADGRHVLYAICTADTADAVSAAWAYLDAAAVAGGKSYYATRWAQGLRTPRAAMTTYYAGFVAGVVQTLTAQAQAHPEWALVLAKPDVVVEEERRRRLRHVNRHAHLDLSTDAYAQGMLDGVDAGTHHTPTLPTADCVAHSTTPPSE